MLRFSIYIAYSVLQISFIAYVVRDLLTLNLNVGELFLFQFLFCLFFLSSKIEQKETSFNDKRIDFGHSQ